jgi:hypothetical protein
MGQEFDSLNEDQRNAFRGQLKKLGLEADALSHEGELVTGATPGPTIFSGDPEESHVPPTLITVNSIAELKALQGVPNEHYSTQGISDAAVDYPDELPQPRMKLAETASDICALQDSLQPEEHAQIVKAAQAYMLGDSEKVASYEPLINAAMFPLEVAVISGESIVVSPGKPLIFKGPKPLTVNYATITVEPGGQIIIETDVNLTTQRFEVKS